MGEIKLLYMGGLHIQRNKLKRLNMRTDILDYPEASILQEDRYNTSSIRQRKLQTFVIL